MSAPAQRSAAAAAMEPLFTPGILHGLRAPSFRWSIAPALAAWLVLLALWSQGGTLALCIAPRATLLDGILAAMAAGFATAEPARWAGEWTLMIVAMMFPLLVPMIGHVAAKSFAGRRERSVALFVAGYALIWAIAAAAASVALIAARAGLSSLGLASSAGLIGCALAGLWQLVPAKERAVNRCHGTVALRPFGPAADRDALRFGALHGTRCVRACGPTMVLPLLGGFAGGLGLAAMAVIFAIALTERARPRPQYGLSAVALFLLGLVSSIAT
jgi:predicted metal-binding membrane protein